MRKTLILTLTLIVLSAVSCGNDSKTESEYNETSSVTVSSESAEIAPEYEDIKIKDIIIPKESRAEIVDWSDTYYGVVVNREYFVTIWVNEISRKYDEDSIVSQIQALSMLGDTPDEIEQVNVEKTDRTSSAFDIYTASYKGNNAYLAFAQYNGYTYVAEIAGPCSYSDWRYPDFSLDTEPFYDSFKDVMDSAKPA